MLKSEQQPCAAMYEHGDLCGGGGPGQATKVCRLTQKRCWHIWSNVQVNLVRLQSCGGPEPHYEEAAGLTYAQRVSNCSWFCKQADAWEATLTTTKKGQAWQIHSAYMAAAENLVVDDKLDVVIRCHAFWRCLESWAALRFSDHRGLSPTSCSLTEAAFKAVLTRTKTTGVVQKIQSRVLHVDSDCWLEHSNWMVVGWKISEESAPWERDYFLPVPTKLPNHWERYECCTSKRSSTTSSIQPFQQRIKRCDHSCWEH